MRRKRIQVHFYGEGDQIVAVYIHSKLQGGVDGGKNPSQQRGSLPIPQVPIRLTNVWYGRPDEVMDPLPSRG